MPLKFFPLEEGAFVIGAHGALRLVENRIPGVDILVRESVQNSLDASLENGDPVTVSFSVHTVSRLSLIPLLENSGGIVADLPSSRCLEIRDGNTTGLTGRKSYSEPNGNQQNDRFLNLVYNLMREQVKEGAGGAWGLGKTVYFRYGIGMVFYYSRTLTDDGNYENRLGCIIAIDNDSEEVNRLAGSAQAMGVGWWSLNEGTAVTDDNLINQILVALGTVPFAEEETGTSVIIPFIDYSTLGRGIDNQFDLIEAIKSSAFKWYFPRMLEEYPYGPRLTISIDGHNLLPYNHSRPLYRNSLIPLYKSICMVARDKNPDNQKISIEEIHYNGHRVGWLAHMMVSREDLAMTAPNYEHPPWEILGIESTDDGGNWPIIATVRKPGMIVRYYSGTNNEDRSWTGQEPLPDSDSFLLAIAMVNSDDMEVENFFRQCESQDHYGWNRPGRHYLTTFRSRTREIISEQCRPVDDMQPREFNSTAMRAGEKLLPNIGQNPQTPESRNAPPIPRAQLGSFDIKPLAFMDNGIIKFRIEGRLREGCRMIATLAAKTLNKSFCRQEWFANMPKHTVFPFRMERISPTRVGDPSGNYNIPEPPDITGESGFNSWEWGNDMGAVALSVKQSDPDTFEVLSTMSEHSWTADFFMKCRNKMAQLDLVVRYERTGGEQ